MRYIIVENYKLEFSESDSIHHTALGRAHGAMVFTTENPINDICERLNRLAGYTRFKVVTLNPIGEMV